MDGENNGKPLLKWMIWGEVFPLFSETSIGFVQNLHFEKSDLTQSKGLMLQSPTDEYHRTGISVPLRQLFKHLCHPPQKKGG